MSKMKQSVRLWLAAFLYTAWLPAALAEAPIRPAILEVRAVWTDAVDEARNPVTVFSEQAPGPPVYLWMSIKAGDAALRLLQEEGKLPIRHKWFRYVGTRPQFDESRQPVDNIPLDIGKQETLDKLGRELDAHGFFDWRTWSVKHNLRRGWWRVYLVYADNTPVLCDGQPCKYSIQVH